MTTSQQTHFVLYDDECSLCTFQMRVITWLDWFNVVTLLPISHPKAAEVAPGIPREALLEAVWGYEAMAFTRTVDMHIAKLRKKIEDCPADPRWILTVHRVGYKFSESPGPS